MIQSSFILLPCHSLEDFPVFHTGDDAHSTLANWTAIWHPALISRCGKMPQWHRVDSPPEDSISSIVFVPSISNDQLPTGYADRMREENSVLVRGLIDRNSIVEELLKVIGPCDIDAELIEDFFALGYGFLQVQLMARMLRYTTYLDEVQFQKLVVEAANFAVEKNDTACREKLASCFDLLCEERNRFYPMDAYLIDLTLVAETTTGKSFQQILAAPQKNNLLITAKTLAFLHEQKPEVFAKLANVDPQTKCLVSGQFEELPTQLISIESALHQVLACNDIYQQLLNRTCHVFARRRFGLGNRYPGILKGTKYSGAVHSTLDEGTHPEGSHPNIRWEGLDGETINATGRTPVSAELADPFLNLGVTIGEALDSAHTATVMFAHWPGKTSEFFGDLIRLSNYAQVLGSFVTLEDYFSQIEDPGFGEEFTADQYLTPFLKQSLIRSGGDLISSSTSYWKRETMIRIARAWDCLAQVVGAEAESFPRSEYQRIRVAHAASIENLLAEDDDALIDDRLNQCQSRLAQGLKPGSPAGNEKLESLLLLNPFSFPRRVYLGGDQGMAGMAGMGGGKSIFARCKKSNEMVVDIPGTGFARLVASRESRKSPAKAISMVENLTVRNEFFELQIDEQTGGIRSIHQYGRRGNVFSQQISMRQRASRQSRGGMSSTYAKMVADQVEITKHNDVCVELTSRGQLVSDDESKRPLATFRQSIRVVRGIRVIQCDVELEPKAMPRNDPWNSYYCLRSAWPNESATIYRSVNDSRNSVSESKFESPQYIEIDDAETRISILTAGLPFHRRLGYRKLDSLLITGSESPRQFRYGIGMNLRNSLHHALEFDQPVFATRQSTQKTESESAFLFHLDQRCLVATDWQALRNEHGKCHGVQIRILECQNRSGRLRITGPFDLIRCCRTNFLSEVEADGQIEDGKAVFEFGANEYFQVEIFWQA